MSGRAGLFATTTNKRTNNKSSRIQKRTYIPIFTAAENMDKDVAQGPLLSTDALIAVPNLAPATPSHETNSTTRMPIPHNFTDR